MFYSVIYLVILIELLIVSLIDVRTKKISNYWVLGNILLFLGLMILFPADYSLYFPKLLYSGAFILVGFLLFCVGLMGAGDSKFLCSLFLVIPNAWCDRVFSSLLVSTLVIGSFSLLISLGKNYEKMVTSLAHRQLSVLHDCFDRQFPYAPVIFIAWMQFGVTLFSAAR